MSELDDSEIWELRVREWSLDHACRNTRYKAQPDRVIEVAEKFYGFLTRRQAAVISMRSTTNEKEEKV